MTASPGPVASAVRAELARRGRTQLQAAEHLGMSQQALNHKLCGRRRLSLDEVQAIAAWLGVPISVLMEEPGALERTEAPPHQCAPPQALSA